MNRESVTPSSVSPAIESSSANRSIKNAKNLMGPEIASLTILSSNNQRQQEHIRNGSVYADGGSRKTAKRKISFKNSSNYKYGGGYLKRKKISKKFCELVADPNTNKCTNGKKCKNQHGDLCDLCQRFILPKNDEMFRKMHIISCKSIIQKEYISQLVQKSKNETCGICYENVIDEAAPERRFGILPNCKHIFCLKCIRIWRKLKMFTNRVRISCPECRIKSDFVYPSRYCFESNDEKQKCIANYKNVLMRKNCRYFKQGAGKCRLGNKCFCKHALPNGELVVADSDTDESSSDSDEISSDSSD